MQIIGEKINGTRKRVNEAILSRDAEFIRRLAGEQLDAGVDLLDVNAGTSPEREADDLVWLVETVQQDVDVPLCLDSVNPVALRQAIQHVKAAPMINSVNGDPERLSGILPIVAARQCMVIALAMDGTGIPKTLDDRLGAARKVIDATREAGVRDNLVYVDPLVMTIATDKEAGLSALATIRAIKAEFPEVHITCGLSNISYGLPGRARLNAAFLTLAMEAGLDSAIVDPNSREFRQSLLITETLLGRDPFCRRYTKAVRAGVFEK